MRVHLDTFDISGLTRVRLIAPELFSAFLQASFAQYVQFFVSPFMWAEIANGLKSDTKLKVLDRIETLKYLQVKDHPAPHEVIAEELYPFVTSDLPLPLFKYAHYERQLELYLEHLEHGLGRGVSKEGFRAHLARQLELNPAESELFYDYVQAAGELKALAMVLDGQTSSREACNRLMLSTDADFQGKNRLFRPMLITSLTASHKITRVKNTNGALVKLSANQLYAAAMSSMLQMWGYHLNEPLTGKSMKLKVPRLRNFLTYYHGRWDSQKKLSINELCDMVQLLYVPDVDIFSIDGPLHRRIHSGFPVPSKISLLDEGILRLVKSLPLTEAESFAISRLLIAAYANRNVSEVEASIRG